MIPSEFELAAFHLVSQYLNQLYHHVLRVILVQLKISYTFN